MKNKFKFILDKAKKRTPEETKQSLIKAGIITEDGKLTDHYKQKTPSYWYFITTHQCVLCGSSSTYRERRLTPKPENPNDRHRYEEFACGSHFI